MRLEVRAGLEVGVGLEAGMRLVGLHLQQVALLREVGGEELHRATQPRLVTTEELHMLLCTRLDKGHLREELRDRRQRADRRRADFNGLPWSPLQSTREPQSPHPLSTHSRARALLLGTRSDSHSQRPTSEESAHPNGHAVNKVLK